jgi:UDP-N-acetylglucosamine 4,6-dehydratase
MNGGELYVPRIPSMNIVDLAEAVAPGSVLREIGMRPGEKLHEEMISADDSRRTTITSSRYIVAPVVAEWGFIPPVGEPMEEGVAYQSNTNTMWMNKEDILSFLSSGS